MPNPKSPAAQEVESIVAKIPDMTANERYALLVDLVMRGTKRYLKNETTDKSKRDDEVGITTESGQSLE